MDANPQGPLTRAALLDFFLAGCKPREQWRVGMELEKMGRDAATGRPLPYEGADPSVRGVLEFLRQRRGGVPVLEGNHLIGVDADWGGISLEPGGQVEWSSRPATDLDALEGALAQHQQWLRRAGEELGVEWLDVGVDPRLPLEDMPWMPKARYGIMRPYLGRRGRLAHRMMTQTASIQCSFDYADAEDWSRKFATAARLSPVAVALFANSSQMEGRDTGHRSFRQSIWRETDPDRCGLPAEVFRPDFGIEAWIEWVLRVPMIFRHRARGLVPAGGARFGELMDRAGCDALRAEDWESLLSTIFTDVRSYTYLEVRCADVQPDLLALAVPSLWTGLLYDERALEEARRLGAVCADHSSWLRAMDEAARSGLEGRLGPRPLRELAEATISLSHDALKRGAACAGKTAGAAALERLAAHHELTSLA